VDATSTPYQQHGWDIHALCSRGGRAARALTGIASGSAGHAEYQVQHTPDEHAQTRPREDVQREVRTEIQARQAYRGSQCPS